MNSTERFPPPSPETVTEFAEQLRQYATHFALSDWDYTRDTGDLEHIRYRRDFTKHNRIDRRVFKALNYLLGYHRRPPEPFMDLAPRGLRMRYIRAKIVLRKERNMPDGVLDGGSIITHWEETGEYLQYVQPSVGAMLADWMDAEPDNSHALKIAGEMRRINARYGKRIADGGVQG